MPMTWSDREDQFGCLKPFWN